MNQNYKTKTSSKLLALMFVLFSFLGNAQIDNNRYKILLSPQPLATCGGVNNSLETVSILGKNATCHDFEITFTLPIGIEYVPGTANITSQTGSGDFVVSEVDISDLNAPIFGVKRPSDANWVVADEVVFEFERSAGCGAVGFLNSGGLFKDAHTINFIDAGGANSDEDLDVSVSSYSLMAASLSIPSIATVNANVGQSYTRNITLAQGGNGCTSTLSYYVVVGSDVDDVYTLSYGGSVLSPSSTSADTLFYDVDMNIAPFLAVGNGDGCFDNGETIVFEESFRVDECVNTSIKHHAYWGCSPLEVCQAAQSQTGSLNFGANVPDISVTRVGTGNTELCNGISYTVRIENTNTNVGAMALDVNVNLGLGHNSSPISTSSSNPLWAFDHQGTRNVSNFRFGANPSFTPNDHASTSYPTYGSGNTFIIPSDFFATDPDGPGGFEDLDNDGFFDDLAPGASTEVSFDFALAPKSNCGTGRFDYMVWEHTYFDVFFKDQCKNDRLPERIDLNYFNIIRDYGYVTTIELPTDINDGDDFEFGISTDFYVGGSGAPTCNGNSMVSNDPSSVWSVSITVPAGMTLAAGAPADFVQTGSVITYSTDQISGRIRQLIEFPLHFTCGANGPISIPYTTHYSCNGGVCFDEDIHCGTINTYAHCPGGCAGPRIIDFQANRVNAGWTDATMTSLVTLDENVHETKKYLAGDTMRIVAKAVVSNASLNNLFLDLEYHTLSAAYGGDSIISFINGNILINDISSSTATGPLTVAPVATTNGSTDHLLTFDLTSYRSLINAGYDYGEGNELDTIEVELFFVFDTDFSDITYHELTNLRGEYFYYSDYPTNTVRVSCDTYGDRAYYARPRIYGSNQTQGTNGCTPSRNYLYFTHNISVGDMHPGEYRPTSMFDSLVVDIPSGARWNGVVDGYWYASEFTPAGDLYNTSNGKLIATEVNGQVIVKPGPGFVNPDQSSLAYPRFYFHWTGTCTSPGTTPFDYTMYFKEFAYSNPNATSFTNHCNFTYVQPTFQFQSPFPTVSGEGYLANLDVNITNTSPDDIDYNWIQVTPPSTFTITGAYSVVGGVETPVTFHQSGGLTWVEAGQVLSGGTSLVRVKGSYTDCNDFDVLVEHGWDCLGYPGYPDATITTSDFEGVSASCYLRNVNITVEPKTAQVQISISNQPTTPQDLCTPFHVELDLVSAQVADLINPYVEFVIPGGATGLTINTINIEYPSNSGDIQAVTTTLTGSTVRINVIEHTAIAALVGVAGNPALNSPDARTAHFDLEIQLECNFISNSPLTFKAYGESPCGDLALGNGVRVVSNAFQVNGAVSPYNALSTINLPGFGAPIQGCGTVETINVVTTISGGTTGGQDSALLILRNGIEFVPGSFVTNGASTASLVTVTTVGDHQEISIGYPTGVATTETIDFEFDIVTLNSICDNIAEVNIVNYVIVPGISCGSTACGDFQVATGFSYEVLPLEKPNLFEASASSGVYTSSPNGSTEFNVNLNIGNDGLDALAGYVYDAYCSDANGNITGASIGTGIIGQGITNGTSITEGINFTATSTCAADSIIIELIPSNTNCQCDTLRIIVPVQSGAPLNLDNDNDGIPDNIEAYSGDEDGDGIPDYEDADFCANNFDGVNGWDCATMGLPDPDDDMDGDGIPNYFDTDFPTCGGLNAAGVCTSFDVDGDGIPNHLDVDSDNDGITDIVELGGTDTNGDGVADDLTDTDGDGIVDLFDNDNTDGPLGTAPCAPQDGCVQANSTSNLFDTDGDGTTDNSGDFDGDGLLNHLDIDADNDGITDIIEAGGIDADGDGHVDYPTAGDPTSMTDANGDGLTDDPVVDTDNNGSADQGVDPSNGGTAINPTNTDGDTTNPDYLDIDSDDDGIVDNVEAQSTPGYVAPTGVDTDGDGLDDAYDGDDELTNGLQAGAGTSVTPNDHDNDGTPDYTDLDSDDDGDLDAVEGWDTDNDGIADTTPTGNDIDNDGLDDAYDNDVNSTDPTNGTTPNTYPNLDSPGTPQLDWREADSDGDGIADGADIDDDNDGIPDIVENGGVDPDAPGAVLIDTDGDGIPDYLDIDSDNDGITDVIEAGGVDTDGNGTSDTTLDTDGDGIPDSVDVDQTAGTDANNDGIDDSAQGGVDTDNDGIQDSSDPDADGNGMADDIEASPLPVDDQDGDGIPNFQDLDSDNDGITDIVEAGGIDPDGDGMAPLNGNGTLANDADGDGLTDDPIVDTTGDGVADQPVDVDAIGGQPLVATNTDGDPLPDYLDLDSDNDGIADVVEAGGIDSNNDGHVDYPTAGDPLSMLDADNDGLTDGPVVDTTGDGLADATVDTDAGGTAIPNLDTDEDGIPNALDLDSDADGLTDAEESSWTNSYSDDNNDGIVGSGVFTDTDGDGWSDLADSDNGGIAPNTVDTDGDTVPNWLDVDSDNDGITDNMEGVNPFTSVTPTGTDTDGDGLDDAYDPDQNGTTTANPDATGANSGPNDADSDNLPNYLDIDSDGDGIIDNIEFQTTSGYQAPGPDTDGNGIADNYETAPGSGIMVSSPNNTDGTDNPDYVDLDSDNDGITVGALSSDQFEHGGITPATGNDSDNDGLDDAYDSDGTSVVDNGGPTNSNEDVLGFPNTQDPSTLEVDFRDEDTFGVPVDTDGDGITDDLDVDDDNDGILDVDEALGFSPNPTNSCIYPATNFEANTLIGGVAGAVGAQYRFTNVMTVNGNSLDAIVEITDITGGAVLIDIDANTSPEWQPHYTVPAPTGTIADMEFEVTIVDPITLAPYPLDRFGGVIYDIDGANAQETVILERPGLYATDANTLLVEVPGPAPGQITFIGPDDTYGGADLGPRLGVYFNYYNVPVFKMRMSAELIAATANTNLGVVSFDVCAINTIFDPSNTTGTGVFPTQVNGGGITEASGPGSGAVFTVNDGPDTDGDGISDDKDLDSDNDGIPDVIEAGGVDSDGDGHPDNGSSTIGDYDATQVTTGVTDNGLPAVLAGTSIIPVDNDGDNIPDYLDLDSDNDGIADVIEAGGTDPNGDGQIGDTPVIDQDQDGFADIVDPLTNDGSDGSGTVPAQSVSGNNPVTIPDSDGDGHVDYLDLDSDNDGIADVIEAGGIDPDGDGYIGTGSITDANNNGWSEDADFNEAGNTLPYTDNDNDGLYNWIDIDADNDGIMDIVETGGVDADGDGHVDYATPGDPTTMVDADNDGFADVVDTDDNGTNITIVDTDTDGLPNYLDIDADNDGIVDNSESQSTAGYIAPLGTDTDGDGLDDNYDSDDQTTVGIQNTTSGTVIIPVNTDGSADNADYLDLDSDDDTYLDAEEGWDTDNDGVADTTPSGTDADQDGLDDAYDTAILDGTNGPNSSNATNGTNPSTYPDLDNAGGDMDWRAPLDSDNDGIADVDDLDDDNDGILDVDEVGTNGLDPTADADGDGVPNYLDDEPTNPLVGNVDGLPENDTDGDGIPDHLDLDSDNDGIPDITEAGGTDVDGDGEIDYPTAGDPSSMNDLDGNGVDDAIDTTPLPNPDTDGDGVVDVLDLDSDNDGITDIIEAGGTDADGDGQVDYGTPGDPTTIVDTDGDGFADSVDPNDSDVVGANDGTGVPLDNEDADHDGIPNYLDLDSDNDGIADIIEAGAIDPDGDGMVPLNTDGTLFTDADGDGLTDDPIVDLNGDGVADQPVDTDVNGGVAIPATDTDMDGNPDYLDIDADNDGITDIIEAGGVDTDNDGHVDYATPGDPTTLVDTDGDGFADVVDTDDNTIPGIADGGANWPTPDTDNDGLSDFIDIDADNDGIVDNIEGQTTNDHVLPTGIDTDGDGLDDAYDSDDETAVGIGSGTGTSIIPNNQDGAEGPDYVDTDSDNDGELDAIEGWDTNDDGIADTAPVGAGVDSDGDGLLDVYENVVLDGTTGLDGTNASNGGTLPTGFPDWDTPGTAELDWREWDTDGDGIPNLTDIDDDNDGIPDVDENGGVDPSSPGAVLVDTDGDGIPDYIDLDSDNDGIADVVEAGGTDFDGDGVIDNQGDDDGDGIPNNVDIDNVGDPLTDDVNNDGINDQFQTGADGDGDGINDANDADADGNGMDDLTELNPLPNLDSDNDGIPNSLDLDSDNDGIADIIEAGGVDTDGDGQVDYTTPGDATTMPDADGDGFADVVDQNDGTTPGANDGGNNWPNEDADGDGIPNVLDLDSDNDGIADIVEAGGVDTDGDGQVPVNTDGTLVTDADGDGLTDDPIVDTDNDGIADQPVDTDVTGGVAITNPDTDMDGNPDALDIDADNDGITDIIEAGGVDVDNDGHVDYGTSGDPATMVDVDGDGFADVVDTDDNTTAGTADGGANWPTPDTDTDGLADYIDIDADNDGIVDNIEGQSTAGYIAPSGVDTDGDGLDNAYDSDDAANTTGTGDGPGTSIVPVNTDLDSMADYVDLDSDNDGEADLIEGWDTDGDGVADTTPTGTDSDNDGLDDAFDTTVLDGTNGSAGTNGSNGGTIPTDFPDVDLPGIGNMDWRELDHDGDGINDVDDIDDDNDGIPDYVEICGPGATGWTCTTDPALDSDGNGLADVLDPNYPNLDTDGDGIPDIYDLDSDNDGIPDIIEGGGVDTNGDGRVDELNPDGTLINDADNDGWADNEGLPNPPDFDNDGQPDFQDLDSDNDGIADLVEEGGVDANNDGYVDTFDPTTGILSDDTDTDGVDDGWTNTTPLTDAEDTDGDGLPDRTDLDSDNDGIPDIVEDGGVDTNHDGEVDNFVDADGDGWDDNNPSDGLADFDHDGIPNHEDLDSDNDGIPDVIESGSPDDNHDGYIDTFDPNTGVLTNDADGDGWDDSNPMTSGDPIDTDNDGHDNYLDLDSDNDGVTDVVESGSEDTNGDGMVDDINPNGTLVDDADGDGWDNSNPMNGDNGNNPNADNPLNTDGDTVPNYVDLDSDNDGLSDIIESGNDDDNGDGMIDGYDVLDPDGWDTPHGQTNPIDSDGDGIIDMIDLDSDNDGISDVEEVGGTDLNNDGMVDDFTDPDGDGWDNNEGTSDPIDTDGDGTPDHLDLDSDDDGIDDVDEGGNGDLDADNDGVIDNLTDTDGNGWDDSGVSTGNVTDTDGDGEPDYQDLDSDNDGLTDEDENDPLGEDSTGTANPIDTDGDGIPDYQDIDSDNDGVTDDLEWDISNDGSGADDCDNDGIPNYLDQDICPISIPEGFSPNADGTHDEFVIDGLEYYPDFNLTILNRWGNKVYVSTPELRDAGLGNWDGRNTEGLSVGGKDLPIGTYFYIFEPNRNSVEGENKYQVEPTKGYIYLNR